MSRYISICGTDSYLMAARIAALRNLNVLVKLTKGCKAWTDGKEFVFSGNADHKTFPGLKVIWLSGKDKNGASCAAHHVYKKESDFLNYLLNG